LVVEAAYILVGVAHRCAPTPLLPRRKGERAEEFLGTRQLFSTVTFLIQEEKEEEEEEDRETEVEVLCIIIEFNSPS
jgi:hypothetical protein|tara:strand:+ start:151 stop:381 length:231 start_codon:yes stop_codon:yes gene_type:complete